MTPVVLVVFVGAIVIPVDGGADVTMGGRGGLELVVGLGGGGGGGLLVSVGKVEFW